MTGVFGKDCQIFFLDHDGVRSKKKKITRRSFGKQEKF